MKVVVSMIKIKNVFYLKRAVQSRIAEKVLVCLCFHFKSAQHVKLTPIFHVSASKFVTNNKPSYSSSMR